MISPSLHRTSPRFAVACQARTPHWRGSVQKPASTPTENIEVYASHCGLGVNPSVMIALADRLAQAEGRWAPFTAPLALRLMFPKPRLD